MKESRYLIVGGGMTGDAACRGIREIDPEGAIVLVGEEPHPPYAQAAAVEGALEGQERGHGLARHRGARRRPARRAPHRRARPGAHAKRATTAASATATRSCCSRRAAVRVGSRSAVTTSSTSARSTTTGICERSPIGRRGVVVIGGGFIGSEIAAALTLNGCAVTMVFPEPGIGARIFPPSLSAALDDYYRDRGVEVWPASSVTEIERGRVALSDGRTLEADAVVAGVGIEPNVELAAAAGLPIANGIVVDALGRVGGREDVFAAGDVARFPCPALGGELRVEHEDHAKNHGKQVGANMAGAGEPYDYLPFFYSDLFDLGYEAVGELDSRLETVIDGDEVGGQMTVYYVDGERRPQGSPALEPLRAGARRERADPRRQAR